MFSSNISYLSKRDKKILEKEPVSELWIIWQVNIKSGGIVQFPKSNMVLELSKHSNNYSIDFYFYLIIIFVVTTIFP